MITYGSTTLTSYNTITKIEVYYYKSTSATSLSGGSWSTTKPTWESGKYIWQKIRTTYEGKLDNGQTFSESDPVNITGQQGATGAAAYSYKLNASDTTVTVSKIGTYSVNKITFTATSKQGTGNVVPYAGQFKIETTINGTTWTTSYTSSGNESSKEFTIPTGIIAIRCSLYQANGTTTLLDIMTIPILNDDRPVATKTYTGLIGSANDAAGASFYFAKIHPDNYTINYKVKMKVRVTAPETYAETIDIQFGGYGSTFSSFDAYTTRTGSIGVYYINLYKATQAGISTNHKGHALGIGLRSSTNPTNTSYKRTIIVDILELDGCTIEMLDTAVKYASIDGTGSTNYYGLTEMAVGTAGQNATNNSNTHYTQYSNSVKAGTNGIKGYTLIMKDGENTWSCFYSGVYKVANTGKPAYTGGFMLGKILYSAGAGAQTSNSSLDTYYNYKSGVNTSTIYDAYPVDLRYSTNCASTLISQRPVYIVGTIENDGLFYLDVSQWWTQTEPTYADGKVYIYVGMAYSAYQVWLSTENPAYIYYNGEFILYDKAQTLQNINTLKNSLETQIDSKVETWCQKTNPANSWTAEERPNHTGDLWYYIGESGTTYKNNTTYQYNGETNVWSAYSANPDLFDKIDGKSTIYYGTTSSITSAEEGDYLVDSENDCTYRWNNGAWVLATDYKQVAIDAIEIGGRNLILGTDNTTETTKSITSTNSSTYIDTYSKLITRILGATEYVVSFEAKADSNRTIKCYWYSPNTTIYAESSTGQISTASDGRCDVSVTSEWKRYWVRWKQSDQADTNKNLIIGRLTRPEEGTITLFIRAVKFESGNKATDWTPAPEDTQADIDTALAQSNIALEQSIEYIVGTQTASTGTWTGVTTDIELKVGKTIAYKLPYAGNGNAVSLVLTLADGSTTDAIPVYLNTTRVTTHFGAGSVINMTYDGQYWRASSIPNSNNFDRRQHNGAIKAKVAISKYHLISGNSTGYQHINASTPFDFGYPILYASDDIEVNKTATSTYEAYPNINFTYTGTIQEGGANKMLWLKGSINGNLFTPASSDYLTTIIPTSDDGMYYIPLGVMTSATNGYFSSSNRIYGYVDNMFQPLDNAAVLRAQSAKNFATATYGLCDTEATTSEKIVECPNFVLFEGARIQIAFTYANTEAIPTLNINNTGVKNIKIGIVECSDANPLYWGSDTQIEFVYDGTDWIIQNAPMTLYGVCSTEQNIAEKIVMCDGAVVCKGTIMYVSMNYSNTAANASLNVADIGAIIINANNEPLLMPSRFNWNAETNPCFTFDGQCWQMDNDTVSAYITDTNDNGIFIHPIDDMSSGWSIGSAIQLFKQNIDYIKLWIENTIAKIRIGREDQGHIILDNESVTINGVKNGEVAKELASFSPIGITFDDKTPYKIGNDETYVQFVDTDEDGVADSLEIVADNISFRNNTSIQNELNVLQNKTDKTSDSLQGVINELNDKDYETRVTQLETNAVERNKYININTSEPSITIATEQGQNNTSLKLQSDKLSFISNSNETAYMANDQMNIPTASITNLFMQSVDNSTGEVFEKIWVMRSNGHLSLKVVKRGE